MADLPEVIGTLTKNQLAFAQARRFASSDVEAAEAIGLATQTVYNWPAEVKEEIDKAIMLLREQDLEEAKGRLKSFANKAVDWLIEEAERPGHSKRLDAIREVLDRAGVQKDRGVSVRDIPTGLIPDSQHIRGINTLVEALRIRVITTDGGGQDAMDSSEYATVDGVFKPSG